MIHSRAMHLFINAPGRKGKGNLFNKCHACYFSEKHWKRLAPDSSSRMVTQARIIVHRAENALGKGENKTHDS